MQYVLYKQIHLGNGENKNDHRHLQEKEFSDEKLMLKTNEIKTFEN